MNFSLDDERKLMKTQPDYHTTISQTLHVVARFLWLREASYENHYIGPWEGGLPVVRARFRIYLESFLLRLLRYRRKPRALILIER